ncbi:glycosyltransferase family 2 protein [Candidatus Bipolaricaulota bacterium]|nr:glycosyltransferase family 2 protein [Candidatus Bipolaricaulota bacterium]
MNISNDILFGFVLFYNSLVLLYFFSINTGYMILLALSGFELRFHLKRRRTTICQEETCELAPEVAILVPAYNEEQTISSSLSSLQELDYPNLELIVVNDGSSDETLKEIKEKFKLIPVAREVEETVECEKVKGVYKSVSDERLLVVDKENGGKADALNAGLNYSRSELFLAIDADSLVEKESLYRLVEPYMTRETNVVGIGGIVRVANGCRIEGSEVKEARTPGKLLPLIQVMEYIRAFLFGRTGWSRINSLPIISGAFGLFKTDLVRQIGGYRTDTVGEDMDLVVRLHKHLRNKGEDYEISFIPDPVCWTQVPSSRKVLSRQRNRWQRGLAEALTYNWKMIGNPKYGSIGLLGLPFFFLFELLGPVVEISGYAVFLVSFFLGWINLPFAILFITLALLYGILLSVSSLLLEEFTLKRYKNPFDRVKLLGMAFLENFGYRQLHALWRLKGLIDFFRKSGSWGEMTRESMESKDN